MTARERVAAAAFAASTIGSIVLAVVYWRGGQTQLEGICLFVVTGGIGFGIVSWAKDATPQEEVTEERHSVASSAEDFEATAAEIEDTTQRVGRRRLMVGLAGAALGAMGAALLFPIRSLGPRPGRNLKSTPYAQRGLRVVREDGTPVRPSDLADDGVLTVWPEGHTDAADSPTLLIRTRRDQNFKPRAGREDWTVDGVVAYSKLCTHVGCPVGLYQAASGLLLCPCHQSTFDVLDGARPVFGPAARSLPQLPLALDSSGDLIARGDFSSPVGPGFWDRDR
ncbi:MAG TPA: Rieske 2Fe-2S domain-containing protein [Acidimicrobiales bacterium]|jgi:ubiquinol-cytochrome c reductase iron-sulfur subunit|nr:Rieske 2Fe-2S domain-containing protein [Acidimicrobiales bacterium]